MFKKKTISLGIPLLITFLLTALLLYQFGERWLHRILLYLSTAVWVRRIVTDFPPARAVAQRFVAGETRAEAIAIAKSLNDKGMLAALDYLGESITNINEANAARDEILQLLAAIHEAGVEAYVSVKLSQLGLHIDPALAHENMRVILTEAKKFNNRVRIDMEETAVTDITFTIYHQLRCEDGFDNVGIVVQAYLYRTEADTIPLIDKGAWVRLCKGAYAEPANLAFPQKADTDNNYVKLTRLMLAKKARQNGVHVAIASHDEAMIQAAIAYATANHIQPDEYEFQMLYGVRRELQDKLVQDGYQMRIYIPYGTAWYSYFMRRLAERPANLWFFASNLLKK
ncbi:MAG: proline dehydrogenase [Chloroflexi bacterium]|nr:MAG: proline dehydrogenase [Chloroflexota bacterium]PIE80862.1 MAG: proline dehydrogenase [Chloroflexota bacterium]